MGELSLTSSWTSRNEYSRMQPHKSHSVEACVIRVKVWCSAKPFYSQTTFALDIANDREGYRLQNAENDGQKRGTLVSAMRWDPERNWRCGDHHPADLVHSGRSSQDGTLGRLGLQSCHPDSTAGL